MLTPPITGNGDLDAYLYNQYITVADALSSVQQSSAYSPSGTFSGYTKRYIHVKYADDNVGTGLSNTPTNKLYLGLFNSASTTESTNPADYTWYLVDGGFSTNKRFWYRTVNGSYLDYVVSDRAPSLLFVEDLGGAIDLAIDINFNNSLGKVAYAKASTNQLASTPYNVTTFGPSSFPANNTWGGSETWSGSLPSVTGSEVVFQIDGLYNPDSNTITWSAPYLANFKVGSLSAINANLGSITAGSLNINNRFIVDASGNTTIQSGTSGARTVITTDTIKVYDASGTLRVHIGNLSV